MGGGGGVMLAVVMFESKAATKAGPFGVPKPVLEIVVEVPPPPW